jgi:L-threonylcarbamoyladenylate synthase
MSVKLSKNQELIELLRTGGVAVIRTDTLYGIVASADLENAVERVYAIKGRDPNKSCIVLLDDMRSAYGRGDELDTDAHRYHSDVPTSFLIDGSGAPNWLLRENSQLAYRVPDDLELRQFLAATGPLIAPSANPQGQPPARTIEEAKAYFAEQVDIYIDGGEVPQDTPPSRLLRVNDDGSVERLR